MSDDLTPAPDSDSWCTPKWLADDLGEFGLDPCSNAFSHIRAKTRLAIAQTDGLLASWWSDSLFVNPPYSSPLPWCLKLANHHGPWCALLKLDPTTKWYAVLMESGATFAPFRKRIAFERADKPPLTANFPSVLVWRDWTPSDALQSRLWMPTDTKQALRSVLELVNRGEYRTHAEQLVLRKAEALVKSHAS